MNLTAYDRRRGNGAWVRGQINSTRWRYSHYNTYTIPTAASRNHGAVTRSRCGDGVSVVMTVPPSVKRYQVSFKPTKVSLHFVCQLRRRAKYTFIKTVIKPIPKRITKNFLYAFIVQLYSNYCVKFDGEWT